jgi:hypothetical protein
MALKYISPADQVELIFALGISYEKNDTARRHFAPSHIKIFINTPRDMYLFTRGQKNKVPQNQLMCARGPFLGL